MSINPEADPHVELYVYTLYRSLFDMPLKQRQEIRDEIRLHVLQIVASYEREGTEHDTAVAIALAQFGDPKKIGNHIVDEWRKENGLEFRYYYGKSAASRIVLWFLIFGMIIWFASLWPGDRKPLGAVVFALIGCAWGFIIPTDGMPFTDRTEKWKLFPKKLNDYQRLINPFVISVLEVAIVVHSYHRVVPGWMPDQFVVIGMGTALSSGFLILGLRNVVCWRRLGAESQQVY
jgi:hypothetical protein